jgi:hypothetical protein
MPKIRMLKSTEGHFDQIHPFLSKQKNNFINIFCVAFFYQTLVMVIGFLVLWPNLNKTRTNWICSGGQMVYTGCFIGTD